MTQTDPLVSVCVQTYQHVDFIRECLDSILMQQTSFHFEIVLGEDESSDGTREICIEYADEHPDLIRLFLRSRKDVIYVNGHATGRYNFIHNLKAARGKYIALLEGDDYWTDPKKLQKQVDFLELHPECVVCHHWHQYAYPKEGIFQVEPAPTENQGYLPTPTASVKEIFANKLRIKTRTTLFRNVIEEYPDWIWKVAYGDVSLSLLLGKHGMFGFIDEPMAVYRQTNKGAASAGKEDVLFFYNHFMNWIKVWEYGIIHYNYQYFYEARNTILYFYSFILSKYSFKVNIFFKLIFYALFFSPLKTTSKLIIGLLVGKIFFSHSILTLFR